MNNEVLFNIEYGLYFLSVNDGKKDNACIINTVMQVTSNPIQLAICVNRNNYTAEVLQKNKKLNLSILTTDTNIDLIKNFGYQTGRNIDKFKDINYIKYSPNGLPYLTEFSNSYISGYVQKEIDLNTHTMFIAQVVAMEVLNNKPTLTYDYYQKHIKQINTSNIKHGWRCKICGYIYENEILPDNYICPICKHGIIDFEKI